MANARTSSLIELSARVEEQLHQFMDDGSGYEEEKKKRNPLLRAATAGGVVVGGVAAKDLYNRNKGMIRSNAKDAAFTGAMRTAKAANTVGNKVSKIGKTAAMAGERRILDRKAGGTALKKTGDLAAEAALKLKKGGGKLRKVAMRNLFNSELAATMLRCERKLTNLGA